MITPFFPSDNSFVGSYVFDQVNEIRNQCDYKIEIVKVVSFFSLEKNYEFGGFRVRIFKVFDLPYFIFPGLFNFLNKVRFLSFLKNEQINNISYSHSHVAYPAAYLVDNLDCKKIVQHHGLDVLQLLNGRSYFLRIFQRKYLIKNTIRRLNKVDLNIGVSKLVLQKISAYNLYKPKAEFVLYNGVDTSKFFCLKRKKNKIFTIGCVANFWEIKDQMTLICAVKSVLLSGVDIKLKFIGSGPTLNYCKDFVKDHHLSKNIFFKEEIEHSKLNCFYNEIDLFVLPSYFEALGCVYLESWAAGTPFIGVHNQGIAEIVPDRENMLINRMNFSELYYKILFFMNNDYKLAPISNFDIRITIGNFLNHEIFN